ncbi:uncharacterized protein LOC112054666 isoform X3 [Bicyclus anynana]|uniref:Uncharacterized protein LOC112054666 isoform X3 n=1 Tax=Bicyclus anynana TaxID=110368 RepID=A0A6J1P206_BICAN|nr:uncharacterized protein LOC112054666 isoform X3 [Bicyclus anynana]
MADTEEYFPRGGKKPTTTYFKQNENFLGGNEQGAKKKKKSKKRSEDDDGYLSDELIQEEDLSYKTCGIWLNYKVMKEGQLFLGRVSTVSDTCVYVSLPCRSSGTVMACHISEAYNKQLEAYVNDQIEQVCELPQMFRPGQYVAVKVLEVQTESSKLMLTMMPQHINSARTLKDLHKGALVQAAVSSVEDHGYVMDIGIANTRAFLPKKSANSDIVHDMGMLVWTVVKSVSADSGVVTLSGELAALQKALQRKPAALLPGTALEFTVDKPLDNGIEGHILDKTTAYIQRYQVDHVKNKKPSLGHKIRARLLYMVPPNNIPFLTMRNIFESTYPDLTQEQKFSSGDIIEEAQVLKIIARSVYMKLGEGSFGLLSLYRIAVHEDLTDEQVLLSSYPIGSTHRVRVTDYNMSDYIYSVSDDAALLAEKYFKLSQLRVGDIVDATITQVHEKYIKTTVGRVTGGVSQKHMYESGIFVDPKKATKSKSSNKKYKEGQVVKARVLLVDNMKNRVTLTLKPSLLDPRIEVLQSYEQAVVGKDYTGVVVDIKTSYLIVSFFNDVTALIPKRLVSAEPLEDITQAFHIGQIVKCTITEVEGKKLIGSLTEVSAIKQNGPNKRTMEEPGQVKAKKKKVDDSVKNQSKQDNLNENGENIGNEMGHIRRVGDIVKATITKVADNHVLATVGEVRCYIQPLHMHDSDPENATKSPNEIFEEGQEVKGRVLTMDTVRNRATLTLKPSLLDPDLEVLQSYEQAVVGKDYTGVVVDIKKHLLISFFSNVTAFVSKHSVSREPVDLTQLFHLGQIVKCTITEVDLGRKKLSGSLIEMPAVKQNRPLKRTMEDPAQVKAKKKKTDDSANETNIEESPVKKTKRKNKEQIDENREHSEFGTEAMEYVRHVGDIVKATITKVADNYALASVGDSRGYIPQIHMQESGIFVDPKKPSKSEPPNEILKVGQKVTARVLVIDNQKNSVTLTLKPSLLDPDLEVLQSYEQAVVGKDYTGIVVDIKKHLLLAFFNNVTVFISKHLVSAQPLDNLTKSFHLGQIVKCTITSVNLESKKLCGSLIGMPANKPTKHTMGDSVEVTAKGIKVENEKDKKLIKKEHSEESDAIDTDVYDDSDQVLSPEDIILIDLSDCLTAKQFKKKKDALQKCIQSKTDQIDEIDKKITSMEQKGLNSKNKKKHSAKHAEKLILQQQIEKLSDTLILIENKLKEDIDSNVNKVKLIDNLRPAVEVPSVKDFWSLDTDVLADKVKEEYSSSSEEEEGEKPKKKRKKLTVAEKAAKAREEEEKIREMEKRAIESENAPQSSDQFERALLAQPDCSQLWIAYMAFHLQATEIEKARAVGRKALSTINFREEGEKLNVWLALLNIEHRFGTKESQQKTLEDALQMNDKYEIHSKLLDILVETSKPQELVALVELMTRKYRRKASVYTACGEACFKASLVEKARQVMQKGIAALEKNEHVSLLVKFAQLERAHGDRERSEALFEQVLAVYPQRVDVCSAYLDVLLKARDVAHVRQVMERMTSLQLPARKMKALYKKWIEVEEKIGDAEHVETIRQRAIQFIDKAKF